MPHATTSRAARVARLCRGSPHPSARTASLSTESTRQRRACVVADPAWPRFGITNTTGLIERISDRLSDDRAEIALRSGGVLFLDRHEAKAEFVTPERLSPDELAHPGLAPVAAVTARWFGRQSFHAGGFAVGNDVWALLADREGGKSTTLAWLAAHGCAVVCDDMLVLDGDEPFVGPRILDLRQEEAAERLGLGDYKGRVGARERWRVQLDAVPADTRFKALRLPQLGSEVVVERGVNSRPLVRVARHVGLRVPPARPERLLELAALPGWEFRRPRGWDRFDEAGSRLLDALAG